MADTRGNGSDWHRVLGELREGAAEVVERRSFVPPPSQARLRRLVYGFLIPFGLLRATFADRARRAAYLKAVVPAMIATLLIGGFFARSAAERLQRREPARPPRPGLSVHGPEGGPRGETRSLGPLSVVRTPAPPAPAPPQPLEGPDAFEAAIERKVEGAVKLAEALDRESAPRGIFFFWAVLTAIYGVLKVVEWVVLAFTRDYQDATQRAVSLATGVPPEDPELKPRVRLDWRWVKKKLKRKLRAAMLIALGLLPLVLLTVLPGGNAIYSAAAFLWTAYWWSVFSLARTRFSWDHPIKDDPFYLKGMDAVAQSPVGAPFRFYARFWRKRSASIQPACAAFERAPYEGAGLGLARFLLDLPILYIFFRPVLAVSAQHIALGRIDYWKQVDPAAPVIAALPVDRNGEAKLIG